MELTEGIPDDSSRDAFGAAAASPALSVACGSAGDGGGEVDTLGARLGAGICTGVARTVSIRRGGEKHCAKFAPLVAGARLPGEAAQQLNRKLFPLLKVRYSTERKRADQCPTESIASGIATCTGLSILLVDACRSVGVPARVAGTPMWSNMRGNHTWVEVWDGDWHFTGAAEPDKNGLDRGWFVHDASQAKRDVPQHAIYATSFKHTGLAFPLVWAPDITWVAAVNVTERYTPKSAPAATNKVRLLVKVLDAPAGKRVAAQVTVAVATNRATKFRATSKDESADLNDILAFLNSRGRELRNRGDGRRASVLRRDLRPAERAGTRHHSTRR